MPRPLRKALSSRRTLLLVLGGGGLVVVALLALGASVQLRQNDDAAPASAAVPTASAPLASAPARLDPNRLLGEARRKATAWHRDAVLLTLTAGPLDDVGVITEGQVEVVYGKPSRQSVSGGAEAGVERFVLSSTGGELVGREARLGKARITPEPNCSFEDAWAAAQRAGADPQAAPSLRYTWSDKYARSIWEVTSTEGQVLRRVDGGNCSILTR